MVFFLIKKIQDFKIQKKNNSRINNFLLKSQIVFVFQFKTLRNVTSKDFYFV